MVIAISDDLTGERRKEAITAGAPYVDTDPGYPELTEAAGFEHVESTDVTTGYLDTLTAWWREWDAEAVELIEIVGNDDYMKRPSQPEPGDHSNPRRAAAQVPDISCANLAATWRGDTVEHDVDHSLHQLLWVGHGNVLVAVDDQTGGTVNRGK